MAYPSGTLGTLRPDLAGALEAFDISEREGYIAQLVLPVFNVTMQSDTIPKILVSELLREAVVERAAGTGYNRDQMKFGTDSYATVDRGVEEVIDDRDRNRYKYYIDAEILAAKRAKRKIWTALEKRVAALIFNTTTWTGASLTTAVATPWSTVATATPITDVTAALLKVYNGSGLRANTVIISYATFLNLRNCAQIIDRLKYNGIQDVRPSKISQSDMAQALGVERVLVASQPRLTNIEGATTAIGSIWGTTMAMVCKTIDPGDQDIRTPGLGRIFNWTEDGSDVDGTVEQYEDTRVRGNVIRVRNDVMEKVLLTESGHLLTSV